MDRVLPKSVDTVIVICTQLYFLFNGYNSMGNTCFMKCNLESGKTSNIVAKMKMKMKRSKSTNKEKLNWSACEWLVWSVFLSHILCEKW